MQVGGPAGVDDSAHVSAAGGVSDERGLDCVRVGLGRAAVASRAREDVVDVPARVVVGEDRAP